VIAREMQDAINTQINEEMYSTNLYLAMACECEGKGFAGFAHWLRLQHAEELRHAHKLIAYLLTRGGRPAVGPVKAPPGEFGSTLEVFEAVLRHEQHVSAAINRLYEQAAASKDAATEVFLQWYVNEQVEEEAHVVDIVNKLKMVGDRGGAVLYLDKEYGKRAP
jgi:ferritin